MYYPSKDNHTEKFGRCGSIISYLDYLFFEGTVHLFKEHYVDNERFIRGGDVRSSCPVLPRDVCRRNATQGVG